MWAARHLFGEDTHLFVNADANGTEGSASEPSALIDSTCMTHSVNNTERAIEKPSFFMQIMTCISEQVLTAGTCLFPQDQLIDFLCIIASGVLIESYGDTVSVRRGPGWVVGSRCIQGPFVSNTTIVAAEDAVVYLIRSENLRMLSEEFPVESDGFNKLRARDIAEVTFRKLYTTTFNGVLTRYFVMWMSYTFQMQNSRRYKLAGFRGLQLQLNSNAKKALTA
eukprot:TRINITY_DN23505_c0_g1_i1.p1 TRINITY_DN23505_c0_g1~~TRINITY_DN23505_c0_g1_i1.p1  ORF type:complete len:223 (+),score=31.18 TRINITY_DN23505_c0_g1_i1:49-717(+)